MTPELVARAIVEMTLEERARLKQLLGGEEGWEMLGVREPRKPNPESPGDAIANPLPADYWETAE